MDGAAKPAGGEAHVSRRDERDPEFVRARVRLWRGLMPDLPGSVFGAHQASLEVSDDPAKETCSEEAWAQRTGPILTDWRKLL